MTIINVPGCYAIYKGPEGTESIRCIVRADDARREDKSKHVQAAVLREWFNDALREQYPDSKFVVFLGDPEFFEIGEFIGAMVAPDRIKVDPFDASLPAYEDDMTYALRHGLPADPRKALTLDDAGYQWVAWPQRNLTQIEESKLRWVVTRIRGESEGSDLTRISGRFANIRKALGLVPLPVQFYVLHTPSPIWGYMGAGGRWYTILEEPQWEHGPELQLTFATDLGASERPDGL